MREIVRARYVRLEFNGCDVLNISELSVDENERIGIIVANDSGKTSLLRFFQEIWRLLLARWSAMEMVYRCIS